METGPIFIGGTGRSGTSVMGDLLNSHPEICLPAHENKLIVEKGGLRDVVGQLGERFDIKRQHYAVADFLVWARKLRALGFRDPVLNEQVRSQMAAPRMTLHKALEEVARQNPGAPFSIHAVGQAFDLGHYDRCVNALVHDLCMSVVAEGLVDTEGLLKPFFIPHVLDRVSALQKARTFLETLYELPVRRASATRWCDDTPSNWLYADFLHELYPDMRFIHMVRDPRDVVGSYMQQVWAPSDPHAIVQIFKAQFAAYDQVKRGLPSDRVMEIRLEDISSDKARVLQELSAFLDVENRFNGGLFFNEKTNSGAYVETMGPEVVAMIETELSGWMKPRGYLS